VLETQSKTLFTGLTSIADLKPGKVTIKARCEAISTRPVRRGLRLTTAVLADESGKLNAVWFNQPYRTQQLGGSDDEFYFSGVFEYNYGKYQLTNPSAELAKDLPIQAERLVPVYHAVRGLKSQVVRKVLEQLRPLMSVLPETLPESVVKPQGLMSRADAISTMHFPKQLQDVEAARERLAFEELFELLLASQLNKLDNQKLVGYHIPFELEVVKQFVSQRRSEAGTSWAFGKTTCPRRSKIRLSRASFGAAGPDFDSRARFSMTRWIALKK
jgi:ATP-dependent DNA helicase RecG